MIVLIIFGLQTIKKKIDILRIKSFQPVLTLHFLLYLLLVSNSLVTLFVVVTHTQETSEKKVRLFIVT